MVRTREELPLHVDGTVDLEKWLAHLQERVPGLDMDLIRSACAMSERAEAEAVAANNIWAPGKSSFMTGLEMAGLLVELGLDQESLVAAIIYRGVRERKIQLTVIHQEFGREVAELVEGVLRMAVISNIQFIAAGPVLGQVQDQVDQARKMLVSLVDDVRVALIKLAERTCAIRAAAKSAPEKRVRLAREVFDIYAPLAHRLGIGHLKWELEDLSFRYIEPEAYTQIAKLLHEKRLDRQGYIDEIIELLQERLDGMGIDCEIDGRAKHIYSIWRKMKQKGIPFSQVYDVRAVRILVPEISNCYQALGVVHSLWHNIPQEFDDYIATPKENGYRSLHTAVIGPAGKILEVQIRTYEMHEESELGVCSHWQYKSIPDDANPANTNPANDDLGNDRRGPGRLQKGTSSYEEKINWLRQILVWHEDLGDPLGLAKDILEEINLDRIYVFTPEGHVIDMIPGATPLDFAYHVHTEIGHRCRGAKVNDQLVALNHPLRTADRVEIITAKDASPRREWLFEHLGYLRTSRARAKVQSWFRRRDRSKNVVEGRGVLQTEFHQLGVEHVDYEAVAANLELASSEHLFAAVGSGEMETGPVIDEALRQTGRNGSQLDLALTKPPAAAASHGGDTIIGLGSLEYELADCCSPRTGDLIVGLIDVNDLVRVHSQDCPVVLFADTFSDQIEVNWDEQSVDTFPVDILIHSYDRVGLLLDITSVLGRERVNMRSVNTELSPMTHRVNLHLTIEVARLEDLLKLLEKIERIPNVIEAKRVTFGDARRGKA